MKIFLTMLLGTLLMLACTSTTDTQEAAASVETTEVVEVVADSTAVEAEVLEVETTTDEVAE